MRRRERTHGALNPRWQESYLYTDGLGREAMTKVQAEPGEAPQRDADGNLVYDEDGNLVVAHTNNRWVGTGRTVYDNKGNPVKKYEPFFSSTYEYEDEDDLVQWGVTPIMYYDPLSRLIRTEFPDGTESRVVFDAWYQETWDQNDCVDGSRWLTERLKPGAPADERTAAVQTQVHANTPSVSYFDSLGRVYLSVENNGLDGNYETRMALDIEGNVLTITDQRGITAFTYKYDIAGMQVYTNNPDAGERFVLIDTMGNPLRTWDSRGQVQRFTYDTLRRSTHTYVQQGVNPEHLMIRTIYGESLADPVNGNHRGKVYQVFDGAGVLTSNTYDFKGNLLGSTRHIANEYQQTPHWDVIDGITDVDAIWTVAQSSLQSQSYFSNVEYDALNRVVKSMTPDGSVTRPFYNEANLLERLELNHRGRGTFTPIVNNIDYNARGQRTIIEYANGVETSYEYDPFTFRMTRLVSMRSSDSMKLQDYRYTFDPVGNIVVFRDNSDWSHLFTRQPVSGDGQYVYDPLYRLVQATGREHPGQQPKHTDPVRGTVPHQNDLQALLRYTEQYEYDEAGNITGMTHTADSNSWSRAYQYSTTSNKLLGTSAPGDPPGTYSYTYTYNPHGSMITMPHISLLNWNYAEQLESTDLGGGGIVYYCYDSSGNRSRKVYEHSGVTEDRVYLGGYEIYRKTRAGTVELERETLHVSDNTKRILLFETKIVDTEHPAGLPQIRQRWQLDNHLGSSSIELDINAQVISYEEYHPFGSTSFHTVDSGAEVSAKRYRYTGKERDYETGLYYYGARYYANWLGRWTGCDPKVGDGWNLYVYVRNNPVILVDPDGMEGIVGLARLILSETKSKATKTYLNLSEKINKRIDDVVTGKLGEYQSKIDSIQNKIQAGEKINEEDKKFLSGFYNKIALGGHIKGMPEASTLMARYLSGKGDPFEKPFKISAKPYKNSSIVKYAQSEMKKHIAKDLSDGRLDMSRFASTEVLKDTPKRNQYTEGIIKDGGILQAEQNNQRLKYADNRFELIATVTDVRDDFVIIEWSVTSKYDFMSYEKQKLQGRNDFTHLMINKTKNQLIKVDDGLSEHLTKEGIAKEFWHQAKWKEKWNTIKKSN